MLRISSAAGRVLAGVVLLLGLGAGCNRPHETEDERIRRQSADAARQIRHDAQNAGAEAQQAARKAGREARDIVAGVREGWQSGAPPGSRADRSRPESRLDLNVASASQLSALPGISPALAKKIAHKRPYDATTDLVNRGLLTQGQYDRVSSRVRVNDRVPN